MPRSFNRAAGEIHAGPSSPCRKLTGLNSTSKSPKSATAGSVESKGRYAKALQGQTVRPRAGRDSHESRPCVRSARGGQRGVHAFRRSSSEVPMKLANGSHPEPGEGSEASDQGTALRKHGECFEIRQTCLRNRSG